MSVWWLPPLFLAASASTVFLSCAIASGAGHISGDNTPHVSHCAMYQPERTVFGLGMTISAIVAAAMVYVIHLRTMLRNPSTSTEGLAHRYGTLFAGLAGPAAIALMGWITVNDFPWLHLILAISALLFFIGVCRLAHPLSSVRAARKKGWDMSCRQGGAVCESGRGI